MVIVSKDGISSNPTANQEMPMSTPDTVYVSFSAKIDPKTTEALLALMADLANKGVPNVYLLLSTPGGSVMHGVTVYNLLRSMPFNLTTHNVGNVNSIGNLIFLAGQHRYACPNSTFMFHGVGFDIPAQMRLEEKFLREKLGGISADQKRIGQIMTERTSLDSDEVSRLFLEAVTKDPEFAVKRGIIHEIREVEIPRGAPIQQLVFQR